MDNGGAMTTVTVEPTRPYDVVIGQGQDSAVANDEQPKKKAKKA